MNNLKSEDKTFVIVVAIIAFTICFLFTLINLPKYLLKRKAFSNGYIQVEYEIIEKNTALKWVKEETYEKP